MKTRLEDRAPPLSLWSCLLAQKAGPQLRQDLVSRETQPLPLQEVFSALGPGSQAMWPRDGNPAALLPSWGSLSLPSGDHPPPPTALPGVHGEMLKGEQCCLVEFGGWGPREGGTRNSPA